MKPWVSRREKRRRKRTIGFYNPPSIIATVKVYPGGSVGTWIAKPKRLLRKRLKRNPLYIVVNKAEFDRLFSPSP